MMMNAVDVVGVSFKYQKANVLQNISFSVPNQKIHALLGPSGSGKTTLLRLMLGRIRPSSGMITVFGSTKPGHFNRQIGYMPQSQALSPELSISETMNYFASLYQLAKRHFEEQKAILTEVFRLPPDDQQIVGTLSGGQQKALSLALVFLHSPRLAILDEPTVGTDPLLGDQIWSFLHRQVDHHGLTVIIVTHYILEASLAHHVAMMRNGRLIEEGTPQSLYLKYAETNLETIFIKICTDKTLTAESSVQKRAQTYQQNIANFLAYDDKPPSSQTPQKVDSLVTAENHQQQKMMGLEIAETSFSNSVSKDPSNSYQQQQQQPQLHQYTSNSYSILWILFILVRRNLQKFLNSKLTTIMLFSPIFCTLLMCITFKVDKIMLPTAVFNEDLKGSALQRYSEEMQRLSKSFQVHHIKYQQYHSLEDAVQAVERGQAVAALWFEKEFSEALTKRALASIVKKKKEEEEENGGDEGEGGDEDVLEEGGGVGDLDESLNELAKNSMIRTMSTTVPTTTTSENDNSTTTEITISPTTTTTPEDLFLETTTQTFITTPKTIIRKSNSTTRSPKRNRNQRSKRRNKHKDYDFDDEDEEDEGDKEEEEEGEGELHRQGNFIPLSNRTLARSSMKLYLDNSNMFYAQPLADMLRFASWELLNQVVSDHGELTVAQPVVVQEVVYAAGTETPDFLLSGYMIAFLYLSQVTLSSQLLIEERKDGFFDRTIVAGARHWLLFASHFVTNFLFSFGQIGAMFLVGFAWYGIPNFGSYWLCFLLALLQSASSIMTGLLISAVCRENFSAFFIALSITLSQLFTSGAVFPIISFDPLISTILSLTPISMPVESLRNVMLRGWTLAHLRVAHGCLTNVVTTLGFGLVALYFFIRRS